VSGENARAWLCVCATHASIACVSSSQSRCCGVYAT